MSKAKSAIQLLAAFISLGAALLILDDAGLPERASTLNQRFGGTMPEIGALAPPFQLRNTKGELITLQPGNANAALVNFWSTACPPCRREMRELQLLHEDHGGSIQIVAVNLNDGIDAVIAWRDELGITFDLLLDPSLMVTRLYQVGGIPTTFLLDRKHSLRRIYHGPVSYEMLLSDMARFTKGA